MAAARFVGRALLLKGRTVCAHLLPKLQELSAAFLQVSSQLFFLALQRHAPLIQAHLFLVQQ